MEDGFAPLIEQDGAQTVRLPERMRLPGTQVRVSRSGKGILLEPVVAAPQDVRAALDRLWSLVGQGPPFMPEGREQPAMPADDDTDMFDDLP